MRITFLSVNSSFSHTSMAYPILRGYCDPEKLHDWTLVECATKEKTERVLHRLSQSQPEMILASAYIFSCKELYEILSRYVLINPQVKVVLGGPEFLGDNEAILRKYPWIDVIVRGEGEIPLKEIFEEKGYGYINGLCWIDEEGRYRDNAKATLAKMEDIVPHYSDLFDERRPFVQYETSRGCPNRCSFCTSSLDTVLRFIPLDDVRKHLQKIAKIGTTEVRILDRTFNIKSSRTLKLMQMFREEFPQLRFHCEVDPALVTDEFLHELKQMPKGQMHIETGLQTFSQDTYDTVQRRSPMDRTVKGLQILCDLENVEIHGDLIGGLPGATRESQLNDLLALIALEPAEIQLENLKLLPGTPMCEYKEIVAAPTPPYEVLRTATMNYDELTQVAEWSRLIDWYYNYQTLQPVLINAIKRQLSFFENFHAHMRSQDAFAQPLNPEKRFRLLYNYLVKIDEQEALFDLAQAWFLAGFSPERGLFPAKTNPSGIADDAEFICGQKEDIEVKRQFVFYHQDKALYINYGKGCINNKKTSISLWKSQVLVPQH